MVGSILNSVFNEDARPAILITIARHAASCSDAPTMIEDAPPDSPGKALAKPEPRIALFGGSFDPVHLGHLEIARRAVEAMNLDQIRFLPCRISPHKSRRPAPAADRLAMLRLAIEGIPWAELDDFDLRDDGPSYSHLTVAAMSRRFPTARLFWLLGRDQWEALPRWEQPERLAAALEFIVPSRDGDPLPRAGWTLHPLRGPAHPASATEIRESARNGPLRTDWLPAAVADYIVRHRLYSA